MITHNMLQCNIKGVTNGFPLGIEASEVEAVEQEFDAEFIQVSPLTADCGSSPVVCQRQPVCPWISLTCNR